MSVMRRGRKVSRPTLILYALASEQARFGLIVSKKVGGAVQRNHIKRQLRHCAGALIDESRPMDVVVRALPTATAPEYDMAADVRSAWIQAARAVRP